MLLLLIVTISAYLVNVIPMFKSQVTQIETQELGSLEHYGLDSSYDSSSCVFFYNQINSITDPLVFFQVFNNSELVIQISKDSYGFQGSWHSLNFDFKSSKAAISHEWGLAMVSIHYIPELEALELMFSILISHQLQSYSVIQYFASISPAISKNYFISIPGTNILSLIHSLSFMSYQSSLLNLLPYDLLPSFTVNHLEPFVMKVKII